MTETKVCSKCEAEKPLADFSKNLPSPQGVRPDCRECVSKRRAESRQSDEDYYRKNHLTKHGISLDTYNKMLNEQNGVCAICFKPDPDRNLSVDHSHLCCSGRYSCGDCVRKLLCGVCNRAIGLFNDDVTLLESAVKYLRGFDGTATP